jgi:hypothetical protein
MLFEILAFIVFLNVMATITLWTSGGTPTGGGRGYPHSGGIAAGEIIR